MPTQDLVKRTNVSSDVSAAFSSVSASFAVGLDDPYPLYRELRQTSPVMEGDLMVKFGVPSVHGGTEDRPAFTLFRYADAMAVLRDSATYSNSLIGKGLAPLVGDLPRLDGYRQRLDQAAAQATGGDGRYVASPRVDSYHSVWFELHEDLIRLTGRTRAEEVASGRA